MLNLALKSSYITATTYFALTHTIHRDGWLMAGWLASSAVRAEPFMPHRRYQSEHLIKYCCCIEYNEDRNTALSPACCQVGWAYMHESRVPVPAWPDRSLALLLFVLG